MRFLKTGAAALLGAALGIATPMVAKHEGVSLTPYDDAVGVRTVCYGSTSPSETSYTHTLDECTALLNKQLKGYSQDVLDATGPNISVQELAAYTSFSYNVGTGAFKNSTLLKKFKAGDREGACNELPRWNKAGGKVLNGLVTRRAEEQKLCLSGVHK